MEILPGTFGTSASFALRFGQTVLSSASLIFMCLDYDFYDYTPFCYLVTVMALVTPWSTTLALIDAYSLLANHIPQQATLVTFIVAGDFVLSFLSLGGACAVGSVIDLLTSSSGGPICSNNNNNNVCKQYQISALTAFLSSFLLFSSTLFNLWILPSLYHL